MKGFVEKKLRFGSRTRRQDPAVPTGLRHEREQLVQYRSDVRALIYSIEHTPSYSTPQWQIGSLRRTLEEIERRLHAAGLHLR